MLGRDWQTKGVRELCLRERQLATAAGFTHTLVRYVDDLHVSTAGQALATLAQRQANGNGAANPPGAGRIEPPPHPYDDPELVRALAAELGIDALAAPEASGHL